MTWTDAWTHSQRASRFRQQGSTRPTRFSGLHSDTAEYFRERPETPKALLNESYDKRSMNALRSSLTWQVRQLIICCGKGRWDAPTEDSARFVDTSAISPVFLHGCSVCHACSIYLYGDPRRVICPLELVRDSVGVAALAFLPERTGSLALPQSGSPQGSHMNPLA